MNAVFRSIPVETAIVDEADVERDRLIALLAHELRAPLAPILHGSLVLQRQVVDPEIAQATARIIERQARLLDRLVGDLVRILRAQPGTIRLQRRRVSMSSIVKSSVKAVTARVRDLDRRLHHTVSPETMDLDADPVRLGQAIENLIDNAVKSSHRGGHIRVKTARDRQSAVVVVSDDGTGFDVADAEAVFAGPTRQGGINADLYLARQFAEAHGGTLTATSAGLHRGSSLTLRIPCAERV